jgi:hypothetical protein
MVVRSYRLIVAGLIVALATMVDAQPATTRSASDDQWSNESNGLRARLSLRRSSVSNGTGIITTYLELENVSDMGNPMLIRGTPIQFKVTDEAGRDVPVSGGPFDGVSFGETELTLPHDSALRYRIGPCGFGVPADQAALLDLGSSYGWVIPRDGKKYYVSGVMEVAGVKEDRSQRGIVWQGRIELPAVPIPTDAERREPVSVEKIRELGEKMLSPDARASDSAMRDLTLIDDPRVVPWYVKAMQTDSYDLKFNALDRLARIEGDEALTGLKIGMATQGKDIGNCTTAKVAAESAENIRHSAAIALARSPHQQARALLWSMENDPARGVRLTVIQTAAEMATPQSLELIRRHTADVDASVRAEAVRLLKVREGARGEPRG